VNNMAIYGGDGPFDEKQYGTIGHLMNTISKQEKYIEYLVSENKRLEKIARSSSVQIENTSRKISILKDFLVTISEDEFVFDKEVSDAIRNKLIPHIDCV